MKLIWTIAMLLAMTCVGLVQAGTPYTWTGNTGNWSDTTKWNPSGTYPGQSVNDDTVTFNGNQGTVTIDQNVTVATIDVTGSENWTWSGSSTLIVSTVFNYGSSGSSSAFNAPMAGTGQVVITAGRIDFNNTNNTFTGNTTVKGGTLAVPRDNALGTAGTLYLGDTGGSSNNSTFYMTASGTMSLPVCVQSGNAGLAKIGADGTYVTPICVGNVTLQKDLTVVGTFRPTKLKGLLTGMGNIMVTGNSSGDGRQVLYQNTSCPTFNGNTIISNNWALLWNFFNTTNTSTSINFGNGTIILNNGTFEVATRAASGVEDGGTVTFTNNINVLPTGGGLGGWMNDDLGGYHSRYMIAFNGAVSLAGELRVGTIQNPSAYDPEGYGGGWGIGKAVRYQGTITLDQSVSRTLRIKLQQDNVNSKLGANLLGNIVDGAGSAGNPLELVNSTSSGLNMVSTNSTYTNGTIISSGIIYVGAPQALGSGPVTVLSGATMRFTNSAGASDWTFTNDLRGFGTIQVESGTNTTKTLTLAGHAIEPGGTGAVGVLTINGQFRLEPVGSTKATLAIQANGTNIFTGSNGSNSCSLLSVNGNCVDLGGQRLRVVLGYVPAYSDAMYILLNDGTDAIVNAFDGQPEGSRVMCQGLANRRYLARITYIANGDGGAVANDVMLNDFSVASQGTVIMVR